MGAAYLFKLARAELTPRAFLNLQTTKMEFKDVAHLYIGSKLNTQGNTTLVGGNLETAINSGWKLILLPLSAMTKEQALEVIKIVWDWTSIEYHGLKKHKGETDNSIGFTCLNEFGEKVGLTIDCHRAPEFSIDGNSLMIPTFKLTAWLTKNHFDIFDLIDSEQAIDATTLETNPYK